MRRFAELYADLDRTAPAAEKVAALAAYFREAPPADAAWAVWFLAGRRHKRLVPARQLAGWAMDVAGIPDWLFEESYAAVGDLVETAALLVDSRPHEPHEPGAASPGGSVPLAVWGGERLPRLRGLAPEEQRALVLGWWRELTGWEVFVLNKLLTGALRVGSPALVERALAAAYGLPAALMGHRLTGAWEPSATFFADLVSPESPADLLAGSAAVGETSPPDLSPEPAPDDSAAEPEAYRVDAVLTYAQPGQGGRAGLLTEYTFGVWSEGRLVTLAKASSGLSDAEVRELDRWIRRHITERFGPVRAVEPAQVFELAFAGLARSARHRSGLAVRAPRIIRWRTDKRPEEASTLEAVQALLDGG
jgi:ATP-dependent DNA ligase